MTTDTRLLAPLLFAILVLATTVGFLIVEKERKHPTIITDARVTRQFEPGAGAGSGLPRRARVTFMVTHPEAHATVRVVDANDDPVSTLADDVAFADDSAQRYTWDGTTAGGESAPPGLYRVRVVFGDLGRDLPLPSMLLAAAPGGG